ncbi:MAG: putative lipoprotein [Francisellaceae bacterium]|jgi:uncharacterized lipoprotein
MKIMYSKTDTIISLLKIGVIFGIVGSIIGCGVFRNRELDYTRNEISQRPSLIVPSSVSKNADIQPYLVVPTDGPNFYAKGPESVAEKSMLPPGYSAKFNVEFLKKEQEAKTVNSSISFNNENVGLILIHEDFNKSWELIDEALSGVSGFVVDDKNRNKKVFFVSDKLSNQKLDVFVLPGDDGLSTNVTVSSNSKVTSSELAHSLLEQLHSQIESNTKVMLDIALVPSKILHSTDTNRNILVIYEPKNSVWPLISNALKESGYAVTSEDNDQSSYFISKNESQDRVYVYQKKITGSVFSDLTNISSGLKSSTVETRIEIFTQQGQLLSTDEATIILQNIQKNLRQ